MEINPKGIRGGNIEGGALGRNTSGIHKIIPVRISAGIFGGFSG